MVELCLSLRHSEFELLVKQNVEVWGFVCCRGKSPIWELLMKHTGNRNHPKCVYYRPLVSPFSPASRNMPLIRRKLTNNHFHAHISLVPDRPPGPPSPAEPCPAQLSQGHCRSCFFSPAEQAPAHCWLFLLLFYHKPCE